MIKATNLINKFNLTIKNQWGYIWGTHGGIWTKAKQASLNHTTDSKRAASRAYGKKWIGHYVADCSGIFVWAFNYFGYTLPHRCRYIWADCCSKRGNLKQGLRADGKRLKPGTAVFKKDQTHMGLYVGKGKVIEAHSSSLGVIETPITDNKWVQWGELKKIDYSGVAGLPRYTNQNPTTVYYSPSISSGIKFKLVKNKYVEITKQYGDWVEIEYKGMSGYTLKKYLRRAL